MTINYSIRYCQEFGDERPAFLVQGTFRVGHWDNKGPKGPGWVYHTEHWFYDFWEKLPVSKQVVAIWKIRYK